MITNLSILLAGVLSFLSHRQTGKLLLRGVGITLPPLWQGPVSVVTGLLVWSVSIQLIGMAGAATTELLILICGIWCILGLWCAAVELKKCKWPVYRRQNGVVVFFAIVFALAAGVNLLLAILPSSKHDEIFYHMLVPQRLLADQSYLFYREPWLAAITPQMGYQILATPVHAIGLADAGNVLSWCLGVQLCVFAFAAVRQTTGKLGLSLFVAAALQVGLYSSIWYTTAGGHALGDLCLAAATVWLCCPRQTVAVHSASMRAYVGGILTVGAAISKVSLLPISAIIMLWALAREWRSGGRWRMLCWGIAPWALFYGPSLLWTWAQTGSPFGPLLFWPFESTVYEPMIRAQFIEHTRNVNQPGLATFAQYLIVDLSPIIWTSIIAYLVLPRIRFGRRFSLTVLFTIQSILIYLWLPHDFRFFGGLIAGGFILAAAGLSETYRIEDTRRIAIVSILVLAPWLGLQYFRAMPMLAAAIGLQSRVAFAQEYIGLYEDFQRLDRVLPPDSNLFMPRGLASFYSPRPVYFHLCDIKPERTGLPTYLLHLGNDPARPRSEWTRPFRMDGKVALADEVYYSAESFPYRYRSPLTQTNSTALRVFAIKGIESAYGRICLSPPFRRLESQ